MTSSGQVDFTPRSSGDKSISRNLTISLVLTLLLIEGIILLSAYTIQTRSMLRELEFQADDYAGKLSDILAVPIWDFDGVQISKIGQGFAQNKFVADLHIRDPRGRLYFKAMPDNLVDWENTISRSKTIIHNNQAIGRVDVYLTIAPYLREAARLRNIVLLTLAGSVIALSLATGLFLRLFMRKPLGILEQGMDQVAAGQFTNHLGRIQHQELSGIAQKFTEMALRVQSREQALKDTNKQLHQEILERQKAEKRILESEAQSRALLDALPDMVFVFGRNGTILKHEGAEDDLLLRPELFLEKTVHEVLPLYLADLHLEKIHETLTTGQLVLYEYTLALVGVEAFFEGRMVPVGQDEVLAIIRNVTKGKLAEQEKIHLEEKLRQAQKMEAVGTLAGGIAHDFNNLLQAVSGNVQLLLERDKNDHEAGRRLLEIEKTVVRGSELVRHLLTFSRKMAPHLQSVDLNSIIRDAVSLLERILPKMVSIQLQPSPDLPRILADSNQIEQVLINLARNASDVMAQGGLITISTSLAERESLQHLGLPADLPGNQFVLLKVSDMGLGMNSETREHIFEPFFTTKGVGQGTGLGLATVYGIIQAHNGHIHCDSIPNHGTTFSMVFPAGDEAQPISEVQFGQDLILEGTETLLLVEDEEIIRESMQELLGQSGYTVLTAASGEEALGLYQAHEPSIALVILDLGMPGMGGEACLEGLRRINPAAKVIIASGYSSSKFAHNPKGHGAADFLPKPYSLNRILTAIRTVLNAEKK